MFHLGRKISVTGMISGPRFSFSLPLHVSIIVFFSLFAFKSNSYYSGKLKRRISCPLVHVRISLSFHPSNDVAFSFQFSVIFPSDVVEKLSKRNDDARRSPEGRCRGLGTNADPSGRWVTCVSVSLLVCVFVCAFLTLCGSVSLVFV